MDANGATLGPPQWPTTLPTLDELLGLQGWDAHNVEQALLQRTARSHAPVEVYTLHAELEGQKLLPAFERLLEGWRAQGHTLVSLAQMVHLQGAQPLPRCEVGMGTVPGRSGTLAVQGRPYTPK